MAEVLQARRRIWGKCTTFHIVWLPPQRGRSRATENSAGLKICGSRPTPAGPSLISSITSTNIQKMTLAFFPSPVTPWASLDNVLCQLVDRPERKLRPEWNSNFSICPRGVGTSGCACQSSMSVRRVIGGLGAKRVGFPCVSISSTGQNASILLPCLAPRLHRTNSPSITCFQHV